MLQLTQVRKGPPMNSCSLLPCMTSTQVQDSKKKNIPSGWGETQMRPGSLGITTLGRVIFPWGCSHYSWFGEWLSTHAYTVSIERTQWVIKTGEEEKEKKKKRKMEICGVGREEMLGRRRSRDNVDGCDQKIL